MTDQQTDLARENESQARINLLFDAALSGFPGSYYISAVCEQRDNLARENERLKAENERLTEMFFQTESITEKGLLPTREMMIAAYAEAERRLKLLQSHRECSVAADKQDATRAMEALSGVGYCTPEETYGFNSSWAISDLIRAVKQFAGGKTGAERRLAAVLEVVEKDGRHARDCDSHNCRCSVCSIEVDDHPCFFDQINGEFILNTERCKGFRWVSNACDCWKFRALAAGKEKA